MSRFGRNQHEWTRELKWRHRFSILTVLSTVALIAWGGFVTSIDAGMAVPDWPASFGSFDPFRTGFHDPSDPAAQWWHSVPIFAEHGHRLLGMLVGLLTMILAGWTWKFDKRRWMRWLGISALVLVIAQGILGGLRVVYVSLDLAVIHACVAQIFFAMMLGMTIFTSKSWVEGTLHPGSEGADRSQVKSMRILAAVTAAVLYGQIILGALLRHPGTGIDQTLVTLHIGGALVATCAIGYTVYRLYQSTTNRLVLRCGQWMTGLLVTQLVLGFTSYFVILNEAGVLQPSNFQVIVNTMHLVIGTFLFASAAALVFYTWRTSVYELEESKARVGSMNQPEHSTAVN